MAEPFTLQVHLTDRCNLRCRHCYRDGAVPDLPLAAWEGVLDDFALFCRRRRSAGRVTFAGGEPLLRAGDLARLAARAREAGLQVHLLTNGLLLDREGVRRLREVGCSRVQVSLDGDRGGHEALRGPGTWDGVLAGLGVLAGEGMPSTVSMTVGDGNAGGLEAVIGVARRFCSRLYVSRRVPRGRGADAGTVDPRTWHGVLGRCLSLSRNHPPGVALRDPLLVRFSRDLRRGHPLAVTGCATGWRGLAVDADGTAYPCRRLPLPLGNLAATSLETIWRHPLLEELRDRDRLRGACGRCPLRWKCGGCRAVACAVAGHHLAPDPHCRRRSFGDTLRNCLAFRGHLT